MNYSPFDTPFEQLTETDLDVLIEKQISEGWYVEFKSDFPRRSGTVDSNKIAKTIAAFANTQGGYYIVGISCTGNLASEVTGIENPAAGNIEDQVSRIISSNITPVPFFQIKLIKLKSNSLVVLIRVEEGMSPPYITSQGIIYQRENNESVPIKDRYIIEKMAEKAKLYEKRIDQFCKFDFAESKASSESRQGFLEVSLFPLPFNASRLNAFESTDFFHRVAEIFFNGANFSFDLDDNYRKEISLTLGFNNIQSGSDHILIRPIKTNSIIDKQTSAQLYRNGGFKFMFPLSRFNVNSPPEYYKESVILNYILDKFSPIQTVTKTRGHFGLPYSDRPTDYNEDERVPTEFIKYLTAIDGVEIMLTISVFIGLYKTIISEFPGAFGEKFGLRAKGVNLWRNFLFFDSEQYLESIKKYGIPVCPYSDIEIPRFLPGHFYETEIGDDSTLFELYEVIMEGIGIPTPSAINYGDVIKSRLDRFAQS